MKKLPLICLILLVGMGAFAQTADTVVYAHRGFRGLSPENTIAAMKHALELGADVLEMDIAFSADKQAVVSHDPWIDPLITLDPQGETIDSSTKIALYDMDYTFIKKYDVGKKGHPDFPKQNRHEAYIPRLVDLIDSVEAYVQKKGLEKPWYSIETKTNKKRDNKVQPAPEEFVKRLMVILKDKGVDKRVIIQSFDVRTLEIVHRDYPSVVTMLNTTKGTLEENLSGMSFQPDYYAPIPELIDAALVAKCKTLGLKLLCGNVNDKKEIDRMFSLGIMEYCTDYPYKDLPN
ncbi:MAG: glycerophosphodiester phosphodiesterase family protein [Sphingobacterium sp.]